MQTSESKQVHGMGTEGLSVRHEYTCETILHFTCGECKNWWSYASPSFSQRHITKMVCPHCGLKSKTELKDESGN